jgi:Flp pilus assembly secretin CpaC
MRYLSLFAAILASTPVCAAEVTDTIEIPAGFAKRWSAPRPFTDVMIGDPDVVDAKAETNQSLVINMNPKAKDRKTNIVLLDEHGEQVANVLITNPPTPTIQYQAARSDETPGAWQIYRKEDECYRICVTIDPATPPIVVSDAPKQIATPFPGGPARNRSHLSTED